MRLRQLAWALVGLLAPPGTAAQELSVFAASSLTEAFTEVAQLFERQNEGAVVLLTFGGSAALATQITQGAPADVFASADEAQMRVVAQAGLTAGQPRVFATNRLALIVSENSGLEELRQLAQPGVLLVLASPEVPVGAYAREALAKMNRVYGPDFSERALANLISEEPNVRQAALKVELGEADAAIVYATDAAVAKGIAEGVRVIAIPEGLNVRASYPVAALAGSAHPDLAQSFTQFVLSSEGQAVLTRRGFQAPE